MNKRNSDEETINDIEVQSGNSKDSNKNGSICKHKHSCAHNMTVSAMRVFLGTFISKFVFSFLLNFRKIIKLRSFKAIYDRLLSFQANKDTMVFALVLSLINFTYKFLLCMFRKYTKFTDKQIAPFAGFVAALWLKTDPNKSRKTMISVLMFSRAFDTVLSIAVRSANESKNKNDVQFYEE